MLNEIRDSLRQLYLEDERPWLVGFNRAKDSAHFEEVWAHLLKRTFFERRQPPANQVLHQHLS